MTKQKFKGKRINIKELFSDEKDGLKELLREMLQEVLEAEMTDTLGASWVSLRLL